MLPSNCRDALEIRNHFQGFIATGSRESHAARALGRNLRVLSAEVGRGCLPERAHVRDTANTLSFIW